MPEATASQVAEQIRGWLVGSLDLKEQEYLDPIALCKQGYGPRERDFPDPNSFREIWPPRR